MYKIEVFMKKNLLDSRAFAFVEDLRESGFRKIDKTSVSSLYSIQGDINDDIVKKIAQELLADKITQDFIITNDSQKKEIIVKDKNIFVEVWYRKGVTDTASESVVKAVKDLGIDKEIKVKTGKKYYMYGSISFENTRIIASKLLANKLIQEYKINHHDSN